MISELFLRDLSLWSCIWQSTLFAVIGLTGSFLLGRRPARASQVLFLAIIAAVLLPAMSVLVRHYGLGLFAEEPIVLPSFDMEISTETPESLLAPEIQLAALEVPTDFVLAENSLWDIEIPWRLIALYGWMITTLILLGRLFIAFVSGIRLLRRAQSDRCEHIRSAADSARARLGITKGLQIRSSENVRSPMIWCWSRPSVLLVPGDLDDRIDWVDVICHELAHWKRWDHISGLIAELAVCILPWNPLLWWSKKRMVRLSEQACDDWVLAGGRTGTDYAQSLLNLSPELQMAFMPTVVGKEKPMKKRIYRIVKEKCGIPRVGARWALVVTIITASAAVGVALAQRRPARFEPPERDEWLTAEQRKRQVLTEQVANLENRAHELRARFEEVKMELAELEESGKGEGEKARALRAEMRGLEMAMARLEREFAELEGERREPEMRPWPEREPQREILRRLEELGHETEMVLQRLAEQNFGRNEEANMLYGRMRELNEQMQQVRQQLGRQLEGPGRQRPEFDMERIRDSFTREFRRGVYSEEQILQMERLRERAQQLELELEQLKGENPERAEKLHAELREIHEEITQIERERDSSRERGALRDFSRRVLQEQAHQLERRLQELGDNHPDEAQELRMQLDQIIRQMRRSQREPVIPERPWPRVEDPMRPGIERRRQNLMNQREQIQARIRELELLLRELNEQEKAESEDARLHQRELRDLQKLLRDTEEELRKSEPDRAREQLEKLLEQLTAAENVLLERGNAELLEQLLEQQKAAENELRKSEAGMTRERGRDDLEREVQNLRKQMDSVNKQMNEMRELMKRLLQKNESPETL